MKILNYFLISIVFFLASCSAIIETPVVGQKVQDTLNQPTATVLTKDTNAEVPKGTWLKTDQDKKIEVVIDEPTIVTVKSESNNTGITEVVLPKNTVVVLPENTYVQTSQPTKVKVEASSEVVLPSGTEVKISKINWYAFLFYAILIIAIISYYIKMKNSECEIDNKD